MPTMTGSASPLSEARWPATPTQVHLADPLLDALIHDIRPAAREFMGWWDPPRLERVVPNLVLEGLRVIADSEGER